MIKHKVLSPREYNTWINIKQRCYNKNDPAYKYYGGRGITLCKEWENSFEAFLNDVGRRPTSKHSIDRIDNSGNYEPSNCRWATHKEQGRNTRRVILSMKKATEIRALYIKGNLSQKDIGLMYNCGPHVIYQVLNYKSWN